MQVVELLRKLNVGNSVAEYDQELGKYFLETEVYDALEQGEVDIVAGDKGTGKTALYTMLASRMANIQQGDAPEVVVAFNPQGSPVFQKLTEQEVAAESKYISIWKTYFFALCGNWLLAHYDKDATPDLQVIHQLLVGLDLRSGSFTPEANFTRIMQRLSNLLNWDAAEMELEIGAEGAFKIKPRVEMKDIESSKTPKTVDIDSALRHLSRCIDGLDKTAWVAMDRLDEAFMGDEVELPALRGLLRAFLDMQELNAIRLKLFLRRDLFRRITQGGFVNLTHINARKREIIWDEEDLKSLLCKRVRENVALIADLNAAELSDDQLFDLLFPEQVDFGKRKPKTWVWIMRRIRDGNDVKPPRNLIDLVRLAIQTQIRSEVRQPRSYEPGMPLIESESLRRALTQLSSDRVSDTLLAEAKGYSAFIEQFRRGRSEHNEGSVGETLGLPAAEVRPVIKALNEMGFLERIRGTYKIPSLYREGLEITQGKAFDATEGADEEEDD